MGISQCFWEIRWIIWKTMKRSLMGNFEKVSFNWLQTKRTQSIRQFAAQKNLIKLLKVSPVKIARNLWEFSNKMLKDHWSFQFLSNPKKFFLLLFFCVFTIYLNFPFLSHLHREKLDSQQKIEWKTNKRILNCAWNILEWKSFATLTFQKVYRKFQYVFMCSFLLIPQKS